MPTRIKITEYLAKHNVTLTDEQYAMVERFVNHEIRNQDNLIGLQKEYIAKLKRELEEIKKNTNNALELIDKAC